MFQDQSTDKSQQWMYVRVLAHLAQPYCKFILVDEKHNYTV